MADISTRANGRLESAMLLRTLIAVFDDTIDAEHVLVALHRSDQPSEQISVVLREETVGNANLANRPVLARAIAASALEVASGWLVGLASLILPDRASYLVAGPLGAVLTSSRDPNPAGNKGWPPSDEAQGNPFIDLENRQLIRALTTFGFGEGEATYMERRVVSGSPMISATSDDPELLRTVHQIFARFNAVYLGLAHTEHHVANAAARALRLGPRSSGEVVVSDAIAPLRRRSANEVDEQESCALPRGRLVVTLQGEEIGTVEDMLNETLTPLGGEADILQSSDEVEARERVIPRYVVVAYGGVLGLGRHFAALPAELVDCDADPARARMTLEEAHSAPRYDPDAPLSRGDEAAIREHFNVGRYWLRENLDAEP